MLIVGGNFETGKPSGYVRRLVEAMAPRRAAIVHNGGDWAALERICQTLPDHGAILWMPDVDNSRPKLVDSIKKLAPRTLLITSKRNDAGRYSFGDLVARALRSHSGLMLELSKSSGGFVAASLMDPLGNVFCQKEVDVANLAAALCARVDFLQLGTRIGSTCLGSRFFEPEDMESPERLEQFFEIVRAHADTFHKLIHGAVHSERLMGNASFRCESGFPAFRMRGDVAFVSRRNIDKRDIGLAGFVAVSLSDEHRVGYWGDPEVKPSVDAPINIRLFNALPRIFWMLHSHTYVRGAPMTEHVLACGDLREADAVLRLVNPEQSSFAINLRGHGSLVGASEPEALRAIEYVERPAPEVHAAES